MSLINSKQRDKYLFCALFLLTFVFIHTSLGCSDSQGQERIPQKTIAAATYRSDSKHTGTYDDLKITFPAVEKWKHFTSSDGINSAPAVADGLVFFGSNDHNFYALDAASGQERWKFGTGNTILMSSPAVLNGTVYFGSMDGFLYALDAKTGVEKWSFETARSSKPPSEFIPDHGVSSSPVLADEVVYFGSYGHRFYALNSTTGEKMWESETNSEIYGAPAVSNGMVYFWSLTKLNALDAKTGKEVWENQVAGLGSTPVVADGLVLYDDGVNLFAYEADTGRLAWNLSIGGGGSFDSGPSVKDGVAFLDDGKGFYAIDIHSGQKKWENPTLGRGTGIPPSIVENSVYFVDSQAYIDQIDTQSGEVRGRYKLQDKFEPYWNTATTLAIANGVIYVGSMDGNLYAIEGGSP